MKKIFTVLYTCLVSIAADADLTQFRWFGGTLSDGPSHIPYGEATVYTYLDTDSIPDVLPYTSNIVGMLVIDPAFFQTRTPYSVNLTVGPSWESGQFNTEYIIGDGSIAGMYAYAIVVPGRYSPISVGDQLAIASSDGPIMDLQPFSNPPELPQNFYPGDVQFGSIPEPSTIALIGFSGATLLFLRRKRFR